MVLKSSKYAQRTLIHIVFFFKFDNIFDILIYHDLKVEK